MRISTTSCLLAGLYCATQAFAHQSQPTPTLTGGHLDDLIPSTTPFPTHPNLELRQNLGVDQDPGVLAPAQVPPVTVYSIVSQVGATGVQEIYTYTQHFINVPDQFPRAKRGTIGYGTHARKRDAEPTPVVNTGIAGRIAWR